MRARAGYRLWRNLSTGVEASALTDTNQEVRRAGLFLRYAWEKGEFSISGGVEGHAWLEMGRQTPKPYAGVSLLGRY